LVAWALHLCPAARARGVALTCGFGRPVVPVGGPNGAVIGVFPGAGTGATCPRAQPFVREGRRKCFARALVRHWVPVSEPARSIPVLGGTRIVAGSGEPNHVGGTTTGRFRRFAGRGVGVLVFCTLLTTHQCWVENTQLRPWRSPTGGYGRAQGIHIRPGDSALLPGGSDPRYFEIALRRTRPHGQKLLVGGGFQMAQGPHQRAAQTEMVGPRARGAHGSHRRNIWAGPGAECGQYTVALSASCISAPAGAAVRLLRTHHRSEISRRLAGRGPKSAA